MTITYQYRVANARLGTFVKLLAMWKGSVYKLVYKEMIIFCALYTAMSLTYRLALNDDQKQTFEKVAMYCGHYTSLIPVSFVLGFYVSIVVHRWWTQFMNVPWPDRTLFMTCCYLHGNDEKARIMRRSVARYMMFGLILICRSISVAVMKRFPTLEHIVESGLVSKEEVIMYENVECKYNKFWVPIFWANSVLVQARKEGKIQTDWGLRMIIEQLADFRDKCSLCFVYDWITIPLVYTQVVTLAVYMFFGACLIGRQFLDPSRGYPGYEYDLYVPIFTLLQFFFYMGWLKVAEQLINPFGEDDDDYDINWLLDRHTAVAMTLVDQMYGKHPALVKDIHFDDALTELPYTEASLYSRKPIFRGSTFNLEVPSLQDQRIVPQEEAEAVTSHRRRTTSFGSNIAGSVLSLFAGRTSTYTRPYYQQSSEHLHHTHMDYLHIPNGHVSFLNPNLENERLISSETNCDPNKTVSSWSSDSDLQRYLAANLNRERANTDADQRDIKKTKKERHRKRSFPLSLLRRLTSDSRKTSHSTVTSNKARKLSLVTNSNNTPSSPKHHDIIDNTPEYVPLRRATSKTEETRKPSLVKNDRRRKISYPLGLLADKEEPDGGSTHSVPGTLESASTKSSRTVQFDPLTYYINTPPNSRKILRARDLEGFTVEHVPEFSVDENNSKHRRNAQKIENALAGKSVSRAPMLSAIEEGNTITSITQILPSDDDSSDEAIKNDVIEEEPENESLEHNESTGNTSSHGVTIPTIIIDPC